MSLPDWGFPRETSESLMCAKERKTRCAKCIEEFYKMTNIKFKESRFKCLKAVSGSIDGSTDIGKGRVGGCNFVYEALIIQSAEKKLCFG
jgi:hypothetical protein